MAGAEAFDWDAANVGHIARHGVTPEEIEDAFASDRLVTLAVQTRNGQERVLCAGPSGTGRVIQFVYTIRNGRIRVVTAHPAKRKLRGKL